MAEKKNIDRVIEWACVRIDSDETYPAMTYEEGVRDALLFVIGDGDAPDGGDDED